MSTKFKFITIFIVLMSLPLLASAAEKISPAVKEMAKIMMSLNHYPSAPEKQSLDNLIKNDSTTDQERILAKAMINLQHKASDADKAALMKVIDDGSAPDSTKSLARIIQSLDHKPSSSDTQQLKAMLQ
jgi:hypothetical protein